MMAIMRMTWTEVLRKRVLLITLWRQASRRSGIFGNVLYLSNLVVAYLSIFSAAGTISGEIENGILLSILPRPVPRWHVFIGKWMGYAGWSMLYGLLLYLAQVVVVGWQYGYAAFTGHLWLMSGVWMLIPLVLTSLTVLGSTYFSTLGNGILVMLVFSFGLLGGFLEVLRVVTASVTIANIGMVISFSASPAFFGPFNSPIVPNPLFVLYVVGYVCVVVLWGAVRFSRQDI